MDNFFSVLIRFFPIIATTFPFDFFIFPCHFYGEHTNLSIKGMEQLIRTISNVKRKIDPGLEIEGILITMADMRTTDHLLAGDH